MNPQALSILEIMAVVGFRQRGEVSSPGASRQPEAGFFSLARNQGIFEALEMLRRRRGVGQPLWVRPGGPMFRFITRRRGGYPTSSPLLPLRNIPCPQLPIIFFHCCGLDF